MADSDGDGVSDHIDNCPLAANSGQADSDGDGSGNLCDAFPNDADNDADSDGVSGHIDNCPLTANSNQADSDGDGAGDQCDAFPNDADNDADSDGVSGHIDNCPLTANADQADSDGDGAGDLCDAFPNDADNDADGDGVSGHIDNCPLTVNPSQADSDGDGKGDACETEEREALAITGVAVPVDFGGYPIGFVWNRLKDYSLAPFQGSTQGNPDDDSVGNPVWGSEWINASALGLDDPWYLQPTQLMTWGGSSERWHGSGSTNNSKWDLNLHLDSSNFGYVPLVRWNNPTGGSIKINVGGKLVLHWYGMDVNPNYPAEPNYWSDYLIGSPTDVNVVVAVRRADGTTEVVMAQRFSKPNPGDTSCMPPAYSDCDYVEIPLDFDLVLEAGDSVFWTHRALTSTPGQNRWITMNDNAVNITRPKSYPELDKFYAVEPQNGVQRLVSIDPDTGETATALKLHGPDNFNSYALAFSLAGELFGWDDVRTQLYRVNLETGEIFYMGVPTHVYKITGLAFDRDGNLYGLNSETDELFSINPATGGATLIGSLGFDTKSSGLAIDFRTNELYAVSGNDNDAVYHINKATGEATVFGAMGVNYHGVGVEFRPATGELYAIRDRNRLMSIDFDTGLGTEVATMDGVNAVSLAATWPPVIDPAKFYAVEPLNAVERLISIDPVTLEVATVLGFGDTGGFACNAIAFSPNGELYGWDNTSARLFRIDLVSGKIIYIGDPDFSYQWISGLAFDSSGNLYGTFAGREELVGIDTTTGEVSMIGSLGFNLKNNGMAVNFQTDELYAMHGKADGAADYLLKIDPNVVPVFEDDNSSNNTGDYSWSYVGTGVSYAYNSAGYIKLDGIQADWQPANVQAEQSVDNLPANGHAKFDFEITRDGVGQSRMFFFIKENADTWYKFVVTDTEYGSTGYTQGVEKRINGVTVDANPADPGSISVGSYTLNAWWSPLQIRLELIDRDTGAIIYKKYLTTSDNTVINPTSFAIRAYRFEANWESLEIGPNVDEIVGELGVDYNDVGIEFHATTGALYAVRDRNRLMQLDEATGAATEVGTLNGIITVSLSAPWPVQ